jgi:O-antigen ligase
MPSLLVSDLRAKIPTLVIFLFPVAGNSVHHWTGAFFWILVIVALTVLKPKEVSLSGPEKVVIGIVGALFFAMVSSSLVNGWNENSTKGLSVQIRYLGFIPIYLLFRGREDSLMWLLRGTALATFVLAGQAIYEVFWLELERSHGVYVSPGLIGIQGLLFSTLLLCGFFNLRVIRLPRWLILVSILCGMTALVLSGSRTTFLTFIIFSVVSGILFLDAKRFVQILAAIGLISVTLFFTNDIVRNQGLSATKELTAYVTSQEKTVQLEHHSVGQRFEMWRTAISLFKENPVFGVGWRNFSERSVALVQQQRAHPSSSQAPHPHNAYLDALVTHGVIGFVLLIFLLGFPFWIARQDKYRGFPPSQMLQLFILLFAINSINEGGTLIYNNTASLYFVFFAALLASVVQVEFRSSPFLQNQRF